MFSSLLRTRFEGKRMESISHLEPAVAVDGLGVN